MCSVITINIHFRGDDVRMPHFVKLIFLQILGPCLLVKIIEIDQEKMGEIKKKSNMPKNDGMNTDINEIPATTVVFTQSESMNNYHGNKTYHDIPGSWLDLAKVLDRLFFIMFLVITVVVSSLILSRRPEIPDKPWKNYNSNYEPIFH